MALARTSPICMSSSSRYARLDRGLWLAGKWWLCALPTSLGQTSEASCAPIYAMRSTQAKSSNVNFPHDSNLDSTGFVRQRLLQLQHFLAGQLVAGLLAAPQLVARLLAAPPANGRDLRGLLLTLLLDLPPANGWGPAANSWGSKFRRVASKRQLFERDLEVQTCPLR